MVLSVLPGPALVWETV